jgi:glycine/D-amino acid oxidase-like deaminating enzyme
VGFIKKVAVIGAGFSGLAAAIELQKLGILTTIFDGNLPYEKASYIASGIIQPFLGQSSKPAFLFETALEASFALFEEAAKFSKAPFLDSHGVFKLVMKPDQVATFKQLEKNFSGVSFQSFDFYPLNKSHEGIKIDQGKTVYSAIYLTALENYFIYLGGKIERRQIEHLDHVIHDFDHVVVAAGKNTQKLLNLPIKHHKGQLLIGSFKKRVHLPFSIAAKGYLSPTSDQGLFTLGSTYEHHYTTENPTDIASKLILNDAKEYLMEEDFSIKEIKVGFRVTKKINGIPLIKKLDQKISVISSMGSRGLLYHALAAKILKNHLIYFTPIQPNLEVV